MRQPRPFFVRNGRLKVVRLYDRYCAQRKPLVTFGRARAKLPAGELKGNVPQPQPEPSSGFRCGRTFPVVRFNTWGQMKRVSPTITGRDMCSALRGLDHSNLVSHFASPLDGS